MGISLSLSNSVPLILVAIVCGVGGQLTLKFAMTQFGRIGAEALNEPVQIGIRLLSSPLVLTGLSFYVLAAVVWLTVLSRVPLSFAYPMVALGYVVTTLLAWLVLGESVPLARWLGIGVISVGVILVSRS